MTKDQRHTAYIILLEESYGNLDSIFGVCQLWGEITDGSLCHWVDLDNLSFEKFKRTLPELYKKRVKDSHYLWNNWTERRAALKQCIEETANF